MSDRPLRVGIVSPSSPVGFVELDRGIARLRSIGFDVVEHPSARDRAFVNAGTDEARAQGLIDFAYDDAIDLIWCARGGYGAARTVPLLAGATTVRGKPKPKTLVGYSDVTFLHEYVRQAWDWRTIHASMVCALPGDGELAASAALARGERASLPYAAPGTLRWLANAPSADVVGHAVGGNLAIWSTLAGTPWQPAAGGRILFFEDISERLYRLDRMVVQIEQSGMFDGCAAIVLGDFNECTDESPTMLDPDGGEGRVPMRPTLTIDEGVRTSLGRVAERFGVPLAAGLPVGHGPNFWPVELGASHRLTIEGALIPTP